MKTSNYVIYIHVPETDEYYLVHGYSGAVDKVTPEVIRYLLDHVDPAHTWHIKDQQLVAETLKGREIGEVSSETVELLVKRAYLTEMSSPEERTYVERLAGFLHRKKVGDTPPGFMFIPSYECNLRCPYCFETETRIELGKLKVLRNVLNERMVDAAYKCIDELTEQRFADRKELLPQKKPITLYGGEPLMAETLPIVEYIVEQGNSRGYGFGAITNAVDLHHYLHLLGPGKIGFLQITLDGPRHIHDKKRIGPRHKNGTYDRIIENIKLALKSETQVSVRYHVDANNIRQTRDLAEDLKKEGLHENPYFGMYTYPIHVFHKGIGEPKHPYLAIHQVQKEIRQLSDEAMAEQASIALASQTSQPKTLKVLVSDEGIQGKIQAYVKDKLMGLYNAGIEPCSATTGLYIFDPFWKIYTCWDSVGMPGHETGSYAPEGATLNQMNTNWLNRSPATIDECKDCKYAFFHFGGCASLPVGTKGTIFGPACYEFQDNFLYIGQRFFKQGLENIVNQPTVPAGIHEASSGIQAGLMEH